MRSLLLCLVMASVSVVSAAPRVFEGIRSVVTLQVLDDRGLAVSNAVVEAWYFNPTARDYGGDFGIGLTDTNGVRQVVGTAFLNMEYRIRKEGYYETEGKHMFEERKEWMNPTSRGRLPSSFTTNIMVVLNRVREPVPMYRIAIETEVPAFDRFLGFDLVQGDWVSPFGRGVTTDVVFRLSGCWRSGADYSTSAELRFCCFGDGIVPLVGSRDHGVSKLKIPYEAPADGYTNCWGWRHGTVTVTNAPIPIQDRWDYNKDRNFAFRVRSETNQYGVVTNSLYGCLYGDLYFKGDVTNGIRLKFYCSLNPTGSRNIEFDPKRAIAPGTPLPPK